MKEDNIIDKITPEESLVILKELIKTNTNLKSKVIKLAKDMFCSVDLNEISDEVFSILDFIDVHDLWDRSGGTSSGEYDSPDEVAYIMIEEALDPFVREMERLISLKMFQQSKLYCMGLLKGIFEFEISSNSEFKDWSVDIPAEIFSDILSIWEKSANDEDKEEMKNFIKKEFSIWSEWAVKCF